MGRLYFYLVRTSGWHLWRSPIPPPTPVVPVPVASTSVVTPGTGRGSITILETGILLRDSSVDVGDFHGTLHRHTPVGRSGYRSYTGVILSHPWPRCRFLRRTTSSVTLRRLLVIMTKRRLFFLFLSETNLHFNLCLLVAWEDKSRELSRVFEESRDDDDGWQNRRH